jgi:hypothetical protein
MKLKHLASLAFAGGLGTFAGLSHAAISLESVPSGTVGPQSTSAPCIIAGTTCQNPAGFEYTNFVQGGAIDSFTESSPTNPEYTVSQFTSIFGTPEFNVAIDVNTAQGGERLVYFRTFIDGNLIAALSYQPVSPSLIGDPANSNGNGYADWLLKTFDLTAYASTATVRFEASWDTTSDGAESFFLVDANGRPPAEVPIPAAAWLIGSGLLTMGAIGRRRIKGMA